MSHPELRHAEMVAWAAEGHRDAMGYLFSDWRLARYHEDGRPVRDAAGRQTFMTHTQWLSKYGRPQVSPLSEPAQQDLFA